MTEPLGLTPRQAVLIRAIGRYWDRAGYSPTYRELNGTLGLASTSSIARLVNAAIARGYVATEPNKRRSLRLTPAGEAYVKQFPAPSVVNPQKEVPA